MEKLDALNKILLATHSINYMASLIFVVNKEMKLFDKGSVHAESIYQKDMMLEDSIKKLGEVMENMGTLIWDHDCSCPIDDRITEPAFDIIIHGKDDLEKGSAVNETLSKISAFIAEKRKQQDHVLLGELEKLIKEL